MTRQRTGFCADPYLRDVIRSRPNMTRISICTSGAAEARKSSGAPILHRLSIIKLNLFSHPCFFQSFFYPSYSYYEVIEALARLQALDNPASRLSIQLNIAVVAPWLNVVLPKTGITICGIDSARSPFAFGPSRCGHLQHRMWPKATKSIPNPYACAN